MNLYRIQCSKFTKKTYNIDIKHKKDEKINS